MRHVFARASGNPLPGGAWCALAASLLLPGFLHGEESCVTCHRALPGALGKVVAESKHDVHSQVGLGCTACHGGDPKASSKKAAKRRSSGYLGVPAFRDIAELCGSCHSSAEYMKRYDPALRIDQLSEYRSSVHGRRAAAGDTRVATCTSCHGAHGVRKVEDYASPVHPLRVARTCGGCHSDAGRMEPYGIPHRQEARYRSSVHARALYQSNDLSSPTCNDCHGNHGAAPPGVSSVANVCGNCHGTQKEYFEKSAHKDAFEEMGVPACVTCHAQHAVAAAGESMLEGKDSVCGSCHDSDEGTQVAARLAGALESLKQSVKAASEKLDAAEKAGMEVSDALYQLREARQEIVQARNQLHSLDVTEVERTLRKGLRVAADSYAAGVRAFDELRFRRRGLYLSLAVIALLIFSLGAWIRVIEGEAASGTPRH